MKDVDLETQVAAEAMVQGMQRGGADERPFPGAKQILQTYQNFYRLQLNCEDTMCIRDEDDPDRNHVLDFLVMQRALDIMFDRTDSTAPESTSLVFHDNRFKIGDTNTRNEHMVEVRNRRMCMKFYVGPCDVVCKLDLPFPFQEQVPLQDDISKKGRILGLYHEARGGYLVGFEKDGNLLATFPGKEIILETRTSRGPQRYFSMDGHSHMEELQLAMPVMKVKPDGGMYR
ncbi:hypothetical protein KY362_02525 [Candidatus Woesearchaeota archaeon]|nr:hypothetical protein [Candidatus Woesearchaeota archaeon]